MFDLRKLVGRVDKRACSMILALVTREESPSPGEYSAIGQREPAGRPPNGRRDSNSDQTLAHKGTHAIAIFFFSLFKGVRLNPFEPSRPKSQSWIRVQSCAFTAYEAEMPSFRLRERRCPRGRSPDQVSFCSGGVLYKGRAESTSVLTRLTGTFVEQGYGVIFLYFP